MKFHILFSVHQLFIFSCIPSVLSHDPIIRSIENDDSVMDTIPSVEKTMVTVQVNCVGKFIQLRALFNRPFFGMVHTRPNRSTCSVTGFGDTSLTVYVPLADPGMTDCGVAIVNGYYTVILDVNWHTVIETVEDRSFLVSCASDQNLNTESIPIRERSSVSAKLMLLRNDEFPKRFMVGWNYDVELSFADDSPKRIKNCFAFGGDSTLIKLVPLTDSNGCAVDALMSPFTFTSSGTRRATARLTLFRFNDSHRFNLQCSFEPCFADDSSCELNQNNCAKFVTTTANHSPETTSRTPNSAFKILTSIRILVNDYSSAIAAADIVEPSTCSYQEEPGLVFLSFSLGFLVLMLITSCSYACYTCPYKIELVSCDKLDTVNLVRGDEPTDRNGVRSAASSESQSRKERNSCKDGQKSPNMRTTPIEQFQREEEKSFAELGNASNTGDAGQEECVHKIQKRSHSMQLDTCSLDSICSNHAIHNNNNNIEEQTTLDQKLDSVSNFGGTLSSRVSAGMERCRSQCSTNVSVFFATVPVSELGSKNEAEQQNTVAENEERALENQVAATHSVQRSPKTPRSVKRKQSANATRKASMEIKNGGHQQTQHQKQSASDSSTLKSTTSTSSKGSRQGNERTVQLNPDPVNGAQFRGYHHQHPPPPPAMIIAPNTCAFTIPDTSKSILRGCTTMNSGPPSIPIRLQMFCKPGNSLAECNNNEPRRLSTTETSSSGATTAATYGGSFVVDSRFNNNNSEANSEELGSVSEIYAQRHEVVSPGFVVDCSAVVPKIVSLMDESRSDDSFHFPRPPSFLEGIKSSSISNVPTPQTSVLMATTANDSLSMFQALRTSAASNNINTKAAAASETRMPAEGSEALVCLSEAEYNQLFALKCSSTLDKRELQAGVSYPTTASSTLDRSVKYAFNEHRHASPTWGTSRM